jgi:hypothetical protein
VITAIGEVLEYLLSLGAFGELLGEVLGEILGPIMLGASLRFSLGEVLVLGDVLGPAVA